MHGTCYLSCTGKCDNCTRSEEVHERDVSEEAHLLLSSVELCGNRFGIVMPIDVLRGSRVSCLHLVFLALISDFLKVLSFEHLSSSPCLLKAVRHISNMPNIHTHLCLHIELASCSSSSITLVHHPSHMCGYESRFVTSNKDKVHALPAYRWVCILLVIL